MSFHNIEYDQKIHANLNESVIHATHRPQDLIPAFRDVIKDTPEYAQTINLIPSHAMEDDDADFWESEDAAYLLEDLFVILDSFAPEGYYFGAHIGDGSDFGYWISEEVIQDREKLEKLARESVSADFYYQLWDSVQEMDDEELIELIACNRDFEKEKQLAESK